MKIDHQKFIHLGIDFVTSPRPILTQQTMLEFQQAILNNGLEFSHVEQNPEFLNIIRDKISPLTIRVISPNQPLGQIIVISQFPKQPLNLFVKEACAVIDAFNDVWGSDKRQVLGGDTTLRELIETTSPHAFQELWEERLEQSAKALAVFDRPVRGGGLRFVLDPKPGDLQSSQMEVKIESYLKDSTKIYVEVQSKWQLSKPQSEFDVEDRLIEVQKFLGEKVHSFLSGDNND
jgi:hypothetical protein